MPVSLSFSHHTRRTRPNRKKYHFLLYLSWIAKTPTESMNTETRSPTQRLKMDSLDGEATTKIKINQHPHSIHQDIQSHHATYLNGIPQRQRSSSARSCIYHNCKQTTSNDSVVMAGL
jgi:hypothetical protein